LPRGRFAFVPRRRIEVALDTVKQPDADADARNYEGVLK
jgi:hypothetical protein